MRAHLLALPLLIAACNPIAQLDDPSLQDVRTQPYPDLVPVDQFAAAPRRTPDLSDQRDGLAARAQALQSRAQTVDGRIDAATRQRLEDGVTNR